MCYEKFFKLLILSSCLILTFNVFCGSQKPVMENNLLQDAFYKIVEEKDFDKNNLQDCLKPSALDIKSGFMHLSFGSQVMGTLQKFFSETKGLLVLEIDVKALCKNGIELKVEANKPEGPKYPHLYARYGLAKIPVSAVKKVFDFSGRL